MNVGIELVQVELGPSGGLAIFLRELLHTAFREHPQHRFLCLCTDDNTEMFAGTPSNVEILVPPPEMYFQQLDHLYQAGRLDVVIRSYPLHGCCKVPLHKQIYLIPDLQHEAYPEFFDPQVLEVRRAGFREALRGAGAIGTISGFSRDTIRRHRATRCSDIFLCPPALVGPGGKHEEKERLAAGDLALPQGDYFLYPANCWPHKNHHRVLRAFEAYLQTSGRETQFVFTGHSDGWSDLQEKFGHLPIQHRQFLPLPQLRWLYQHALAMVFFSLYEGFGMPLLDAFRWDTPVICSNVTSLPEVAGDAAVMCDPTDVAAMAELMERISTDEPLRDRLIFAGRKRLQAYNWESSARELMAACSRVARRSRWRLNWVSIRMFQGST